MKKKTWMLLGAVLLSVAVLVAVGVTTAYLTDRETADNVITIGKVSVELEEGFEPQVVVPGSVVPKAPRLTNDGNKDEYVFLKITVPKKKVTLLYEQNVKDPENSSILLHAKGTPKTDPPTQEMAEIFRFLADPRTIEDTTTTTTVEPANVNRPAAPSAPVGFDVDFAYHHAVGVSETGWLADSPEGWIWLEADTEADGFNTYVFGYSKKLAPAGTTVTLFDRVQLKSFIDGEAITRESSGTSGGDSTTETGSPAETAPPPDKTEIGVYAYAIQADNLELDVTPDEPMTQAMLQEVWKIIKNKNGETTSGTSG